MTDEVLNPEGEFSPGDICEVFRCPDECAGVEGADANVGKKVKIVDFDTIGSLIFGDSCYVVEFVDGPSRVYASDDINNFEERPQGSCPANCLRRVAS